MKEHDGAIGEIYGDVPLTSEPVDPEHPTFDSLLGALEGVHRGALAMNVLQAYHQSLSKQLQDSKAKVASLQAPVDTSAPELTGQRMAVTVLDLVAAMLDSVDEYIRNPGQETMASTLNLLLQCMGYMHTLNSLLDREGER